MRTKPPIVVDDVITSPYENDTKTFSSAQFFFRLPWRNVDTFPFAQLAHLNAMSLSDQRAGEVVDQGRRTHASGDASKCLLDGDFVHLAPEVFRSRQGRE